MPIQSEHALERGLIQKLETLGFERVRIETEDDLIANLKLQLEKHNKIALSDAEFNQVLNKLNRGNIFEKAKILRDKIDYTQDDGKVNHIEQIDQIHYCKNQYQVTNQVAMCGKYKNRYDVTLLINGMPLVQIELKRRGLEIKEAFNQTLRYWRESYQAGSGLFNYIQVFVISNGINTKYYANNPNSKQDFKQAFYWTDPHNRKASRLDDFAEAFLEKCQLSKLITKYIVLNESAQMLMVLRPYQYYAVERIVERVKNTEKHGYIWHTTGSGKTLTSFKAAQILTQSSHVRKVLFVVDRKDLDFQTIKEFNSFSAGSVDATGNTKMLVKQLKDDTPLIVTTLQKLSIATSKTRFVEQLPVELIKGKVVLIFDECHRSQFGETHNQIRNFFSNAQMFGFTGTPIFAENSSATAHGRRTTKDLFDNCLHKYVITDAIRDGNVLKFSIEYIQTVRQKDSATDVQVEAIDTVEAVEADARIDAIVNHVLANHNRKTHGKEFTSIFCTSGIPTLIKYYEAFKRKIAQSQQNLQIAAIFSYHVNENDRDEAGFLETDLADAGAGKGNRQSRESLERCIADYNEAFGTNYSTESFYGYYQDLGKRVRDRRVDILLVVNMFLTGFDSKYLNTIYVDKNLKYHGLIQAYSRTNRTLGTKKSQGNVVCFRKLKTATDQAIELFANKDAIEEIVLLPYEDYVARFNEVVKELKSIAPTVDAVNELVTEDEKAEFIKSFRNLIRQKNVLVCFFEFDHGDLMIDEQEFADYQSKYLDLHEEAKGDRGKEKVSILDDLDFELELIHRDDINVGYILTLLEQVCDADEKEREKTLDYISRVLETEVQLRSKKELIEHFIAEHMAELSQGKGGSLRDTFRDYWDHAAKIALQQLAASEGLKEVGLKNLIDELIFTGKTPLTQEIIDIFNTQPRLIERMPTANNVIDKVKQFVEIYFDEIE